MGTDDEDLGTVRWFGRAWGAPVNDPRAKIDVPIGAECTRCHLLFEDYHRGVRIPMASPTAEDFAYYHLDCFMYTIGFDVTSEVFGP